ncbi:uncharacterized protein RCC_03683 [Ramularia collo-cygni]|uniref:Uncharacterized protein n=1 Tax=Ramularia collo-cygni TaxID=112498 RepID=A0A2D3UZL7_9PEZI|nr:uncharacterized protein RCC_03683 [Ramularia collo-cygni]CZT17847.1 uncharacterized protein RCC_03683 [Ramularia collo-cygni]
MATIPKLLRAIRTTPTTAAVVVRRNNYTTGPFKDPWSYPASARESPQSFREAKVEFTIPPTNKTPSPSPILAALTTTTPKAKPEKMTLSEIEKSPHPMTLKASVGPAQHIEWNRYPYDFLSHLDENEVFWGLRPALFFPVYVKEVKEVWEGNTEYTLHGL